jgi:methylated-DNA-[protein]-cysteine S-methyltransferase
VSKGRTSRPPEISCRRCPNPRHGRRRHIRARSPSPRPVRPARLRVREATVGRFSPQPDESADTDHPLLDRIDAYLDGTDESFTNVDVALTLPTDRRAVVETLRAVEHGQSVTVEALVRTTPGLDGGSEEDHQTVRAALADNPTPLVIGDHRVRDGPNAAPSDVATRLRSLEGL